MERIYHGKRFDVALLKGEKSTREVVVHPGASLILPLLDAKNLILIRNKRECVADTLWELPAGTLEPPEPPLQCAQRELLEETGYHAKNWLPLLHFYVSPGYCTEKMHLFLATDLTLSQQQLNETEEIDVHIIPFETALHMIHEHQIIDGKTIAALLYYKAFYS